MYQVSWFKTEDGKVTEKEWITFDTWEEMEKNLETFLVEVMILAGFETQKVTITMILYLILLVLGLSLI